MKKNIFWTIFIVFSVILASGIIFYSDLVYEKTGSAYKQKLTDKKEEDRFNAPKESCEELCGQKGFMSSRCGGAAVMPGRTDCKDNETRIGWSSDCNHLSPDGKSITIGATKACCCR